MSNKHTHGQPRQSRRKHRRIDYYPTPAAQAAINAKWGCTYPLNTFSGVLNAILAEWVVLAGIEMLPEFRPMSPIPNAGIDRPLRVPTNESGADLPAWGRSWLEERQAAAEHRQANRRVICGAKTQSGRPCRGKSLPGKRRCKWHGGCSTGPKTEEGRAKALANLRQYQRRLPTSAAEVARARVRGGRPLEVPTAWPAERG